MARAQNYTKYLFYSYCFIQCDRTNTINFDEDFLYSTESITSKFLKNLQHNSEWNDLISLESELKCLIEKKFHSKIWLSLLPNVKNDFFGLPIANTLHYLSNELFSCHSRFLRYESPKMVKSIWKLNTISTNRHHICPSWVLTRVEWYTKHIFRMEWSLVNSLNKGSIFGCNYTECWTLFNFICIDEHNWSSKAFCVSFAK